MLDVMQHIVDKRDIDFLRKRRVVKFTQDALNVDDSLLRSRHQDVLDQFLVYIHGVYLAARPYGSRELHREDATPRSNVGNLLARLQSELAQDIGDFEPFNASWRIERGYPLFGGTSCELRRCGCRGRDADKQRRTCKQSSFQHECLIARRSFIAALASARRFPDLFLSRSSSCLC